MMDSCAGPSELHLKKELTALRNARLLRDPETCSSWRPPLSSKSLAVASGLSINNTTRGNSSSVNDAAAVSAPSQSDLRRKKVYLYNWRHHPGQSSGNELELDDDDWKLSVEESPEDSLRNHHRSDINLEVPVNIRSVRCKNLVTPISRTRRKTKTNAAFKQRVVKNSKVSMLLDLPTSSLEDHDSFEQSDETEYCNSDYTGHVTQGVAKRNSFSHPASPLFSVSGCGSWSYSSKLLRNTRREASSRSCTPASTGSYYKYGGQNLSNVGSWDETPASEDDLDQLDLPVRQGCGLPCYSSKRTKDRGCGGGSSPSLSFILRRTGSSILCGGQILHQKKRSVSSHKKSYLPKSSQNLPLLANSSYRGGSLDSESDELSTNIGELELEALSRLDGKRWSTCRSRKGLEVVRSGEADLQLHNHRSLSQRYRPKAFGDITGQSIVVHSLSNAILKGKISSAYLFHGPHGTGKTSAARIFASAMNCLSTNKNKPCGFCRECTHVASGSGSHILEIDAADKKALDSVKYILKNTSVSTTSSRYMVVVIDQCHMLSSKLWLAFMKFLEEPFHRFVFIFITIDPCNLSRAVVSRCQKYLFSKVKDVDIVTRLKKLSLEENLDIDLDALDLIAVNSDGSLSDAETMLDQLSLLGKRISTSLVNDLVGIVSDDKLLDLLEIAMASNTAETVKRSRELMDSGVEPVALMSQLASLIMDIIAGTYCLTSSQCSSKAIVNRSLTKVELERLQQALKILSDAEKQLRFSSEGSTWFTAALLQLGSGLDTEPTKSSSSSGNSSNHSLKELKMDALEKGTSFHMCRPSLKIEDSSLALVPLVNSGSSTRRCCRTPCLVPNQTVSSGVLPADSQSVVGSLHNAKGTDTGSGITDIKSVKSDILNAIWKRCIDECHSKALRQLLYAHGRLLSISEVDGVLIASLTFEDNNVKTRAERYLSSITNSIETVLKHNVEVRIEFVPKKHTNSLNLVQQSPASCHSKKSGLLDNKGNSESGNVTWYSDKKREKGASDLSKESMNYAEPKRQGTLGRSANYLLESKGFQVASSPIIPSEGNIEAHGALEKGNKTSAMLIAPALAADEQRLESAWLQAAEKNASGVVSHTKHETSHVLPRNGATQNHNESSVSGSLKELEDELIDGFRALKMRETQGHQKKGIGRQTDHYAMSPSLLHSNNSAVNLEKEKLGYESGPGCNGLFCWNARKPPGGKGTHRKPKRTYHISLFGNCGKPKTPGSRSRTRLT